MDANIGDKTIKLMQPRSERNVAIQDRTAHNRTGNKETKSLDKNHLDNKINEVVEEKVVPYWFGNKSELVFPMELW